jgi:cellulose synthase/poly-beta-1,6-N-acetylglucosamine synthase-like glycosyltransferase
VSFIIAAYNEEATIEAKLENTLRLDYPKEKLEVIVVADGSNDATVDIASRYISRGVRVLHRPEREGKTNALNHAVGTASSEILFFSDANTMYSPDVVGVMMRSFADSRVGGVSGRKVVLEDLGRDATRGEGAYWSYETSLKQAESEVASIATADGEIFAMRRSIFQPIPRHIVHDDMYLTVKIVEAGFRVVMEPDAKSAEFASRTLMDEFHLKVRYASAGYQILATFPGMLLNPTRWFAWVFFSHKLTRWMAPFFLLGALVSSALIPWSPFFLLVFWLQVAFYLMAVAAGLLPKKFCTGIVYFPLYFSLMNTAALYGAAKYVAVGQSPLWRKAQR